MDLKWKERLVGPIVSLPTFNDDKYNLLLDRQRIHIRWLMEQGISEGNGVLLIAGGVGETYICLLYTSPSPRDGLLSRMPSSA